MPVFGREAQWGAICGGILVAVTVWLLYVPPVVQ